MKVIKEPESWSIRKRCNCGSLLLVSKEDLHLLPVFDKELKKEVYNFICPVCDKKNIIDFKFIPKKVKTSLEKTYFSRLETSS